MGQRIQILQDLNMPTLQYPPRVPVYEREERHPQRFSHTLKPLLERESQRLWPKLTRAPSVSDVWASLVGTTLAHSDTQPLAHPRVSGFIH